MPTVKDIQQYIQPLTKTDWCDIFCFAVLIGGIIYSPFLFTMGLIFMVLRILFIGSVKEKINKLKQSYSILLCLLSIYILNIVGMLWTENLSGGLFELNHKLPFLILPFFALVISPMKQRSINIIFALYTSAVTVGIFIGFIHYLIDPYADSRVLVPTARNISFAFHICFSLSVMVITAYRNKHLRKYLVPLCVLFVGYLFVASLISGIISLLILFLSAVIIILRRKNKTYSLIVIILLVLVVISGAYWIYKQWDNYFTPKEEFAFSEKEKTALGNDYIHFNNKAIENGYYVNKYCCPKEIDSSWLQRTGTKTTDYCEGKYGIDNYRYKSVIYRYLTSKGLRKDASGIAELTEKDIQNIKKGYSNVVYTERFSLKPRLYQTFYEFERYMRTSEVEDMSIIQRYFWSKNAINIIKQHLIIGCGTGDTRDCLVAPVIDEYPELCTTGCNPHNQFIYIMAAFGLLGLAVMLFYILYLPIRLQLFKNKYFVAFFIIALCWMFAESSFESFEGMTFISALMSMFAYFKRFSMDLATVKN